MLKVLVTGGAGFIGSHIVDKLIERQARVYVLDNLSTGSLDNLHPQAIFLHKDIRDRDMAGLFRQEQFDVVIHQAAQTTVPKSLSDPRYDADVNIMGLVNILEACRVSGVKRVVFASSAAVYGDTEKLPIEEMAVKQPTAFYGLSKLTAEHYLAMYYRNFGLEYVVLRYANVYGERQAESGEGGVISIFVKKILAGDTLVIDGDGTQTRDYIYVRDVAEANVKALFTPHAQQCYNISTGQETSLLELIEVLRQVTGKEVKIAYGPRRKQDIHRSVLSNEAARKALLWQPTHSLGEGLKLMLQAKRILLFNRGAKNKSKRENAS